MCGIMAYCGLGADKKLLEKSFAETKSRGPDDTRILDVGDGVMAFHRLAIMGLHDEGMQPFKRGDNYVVCNGEIYGFRPLKEELVAEGYAFESDSDCEILLPLYEKLGVR